MEACHKGWGVSTIIGVAASGKGKLILLLFIDYYYYYLFIIILFRNFNSSIPAGNWSCLERYSVWWLEEQGWCTSVSREVFVWHHES